VAHFKSALEMAGNVLVLHSGLATAELRKQQIFEIVKLEQHYLIMYFL
jgi:hypothetical protein